MQFEEMKYIMQTKIEKNLTIENDKIWTKIKTPPCHIKFRKSKTKTNKTKNRSWIAKSGVSIQLTRYSKTVWDSFELILLRWSYNTTIDLSFYTFRGSKLARSTPDSYVHLACWFPVQSCFRRFSPGTPVFLLHLKLDQKWSKIEWEGPPGNQWYTLSEATLSRYGLFIYLFTSNYITGTLHFDLATCAKYTSAILLLSEAWIKTEKSTLKFKS